jgi:hypothetical protein
MREPRNIILRDILAVISRNSLLTLCLASGVGMQGVAQIRVGVWTDRPVYQFGDTVRITVTALNASSDTAHLSFHTATQANYLFDDYDFYAHNGGWDILTSATIPPSGSVSWTELRYPYGQDQSPLSVGTHTLVGEVLGYGKSDTMAVIVTMKPTTSVAGEKPTSECFILDQNYPNPFNPTTTIRYVLPRLSHVQLTVFDMLGQKVATLVDGKVEAGYHETNFDANGLPSGAYFCRLLAGGQMKTKRLVLLR